MAKRITGKKTLSIALCLFMLIALGAAAFMMRPFLGRTSFSGNNPQKNDGRMKDDLARLSSDAYGGVLLSMHSTENFSEEDFLFYRGVDTAVASHALLGAKEFSKYLDCILGSGNALSHIYLCLDPELLWMGAREKTDKWNSDLQEGLYSYVESCPDISFEILLPYPYIEYWLALNEEDLETLLAVYHALISELSAYPNVKIFFPGFEEWLMVNPDNYTDTLFDANEIITQKLFLYTFCDAAYQITPINEDFFWNSIRGTVDREKIAPTCYPDLSDWCLVFFGDSVLGNYNGSFSIPGYIAGLSKAATCNYAIGGTCATAHGEADFPNYVIKFLAENMTRTDDGCLFIPAGSGESPAEDKKLCFIINYGLNDYFTGSPVENPLDPNDAANYKGGLRVGISRLQEAFPDASYIVMTPTHTGSFNMGMNVNSETGDVFSAYIDAAEELAREMGLYYLDNYHDFIIAPETLDTYLADDTHANERGRLVIAARIMDFIHNEVK